MNNSFFRLIICFSVPLSKLLDNGTESMMQFDVAPTIAYIFKLKQPQVWIGRPMKQVFK